MMIDTLHIDDLPATPVAARIGLLALATDLNSEADLRRMLPADVGLYCNRVRHENPMSLEALQRVAEDLPRAGRDLLPGLALDVLVYSCTSGTIAMGEAQTLRLLNEVRAARHATTPVTASLAALAQVGAHKVSMLTPYRAAVNRELGSYYRERGLDVLNVSGFDMDDDYAMSDIAPEALVAAGIRATAADADALFISCTALRASEAIERIERAIGRPVITSNQAVIWHALHLMQLAAPRHAPGRLFNATRVR
ncbi:maleate cis-trans isomerase family protein [Thauera mechernichensis]